MQHTIVLDVLNAIEYPKEGILSHIIFKGERMHATLFAMTAGQEMSEHTTSMEAMLHFLEGEIELTVEDKQYTAAAGTWLRMAPRVAHSLVANTNSKFYLVTIRP
ncbi:MAG: cupin domain-containing protein [Candidatus Hydrogenedentes bacterium]|nr:cupin domain-containing protein [Candidatus Hydrogenedentota bacterium]